MGKNSGIEWTDHTFNPWWGCQKVSPACANCYAETWAKRTGKNGLWGKDSERCVTSPRNWKEPLKWDREAEEAGERRRVFCASMADVFEDRRDLDDARARLWELIDKTPHLDWLLLTKRIERAKELAPWEGPWPRNVWIGTTVEDQKRADERIPLLFEIPAVIRFISAEPLLGPIDLSRFRLLDWVITGGESGPGARPSHPDWFRSLRDQCKAAGVPFLMKQWGEWGERNDDRHGNDHPMIRLTSTGNNGSRLDATGDNHVWVEMVGRARTGCLLDGVEHKDFPEMTL